VGKGLRKALVFYAIALSLAVLVRVATPVLGEASAVVTMLTPAVAVAIMLTLVAPEGGWRKVLPDLGLTSAGVKGWPLAIGGPVLIQLCSLVVVLSLGLTARVRPEVTAPAAEFGVEVRSGLVVGTVFAMCEEVGWRGYMLPRMLSMGLVPAMLAVGFLHGVWHLPLLLTTDYYHATGNPWIVAPLFLVTLTLAGVFYGFLRVWTGSVWPVAIAHSAVNMAWALSSEVSATQSPVVLESIGGESGLIMICGLLIADLILIRVVRRSTQNQVLAEQT
jgi:membrane protease YdiL (CAAX protease family)